jgi:T-complex protein 1 subunit alpha
MVSLVPCHKTLYTLYHSSGKVYDAAAAFKNYGLNLVAGEIRDNLAAGVVEPVMYKIKSFRFATEAAITILRIDDRIIVHPEP